MSNASARWLILVSALLSTSCQTGEVSRTDATIVTEDSVLSERARSGTQRSSIKMMVSEQGVGGVTQNTLFNKEELQVALPGFKLVKEVLASEGEPYPIFKAYKESEPILTIVPSLSTKKIGSVWVSSNLVRNALGHTLGTLFENIYAHGKLANCRAGMEEYSGMVICTAPSGRHIKYLFEGYWNGPDGELPPTNAMALWLLTKIIWIPPPDLL